MSSPLADRLRPEKIEDMVGQKHLDKLLKKLVKDASKSDILRAVGHRQNDACQNYSKNHKPQAA